MNGKSIFHALAHILLLLGVLLVPLTLSTVIEKPQVVGVTSPRDIYVDGNNTGDPFQDGSQSHPFDAIQEGVNAASSGDTIRVAGNHTYYETVSIDKSISLLKWKHTDPDPVIDGSIGGGEEGHVVGIYASDVTVNGFVIANSTRMPHYGVYVYAGDRINITGNVITTHDYGIYVQEGQLIQDLNITNNAINDTFTGIEGLGTIDGVYFILGAYVAKNTIYGSELAYDQGTGIELYGENNQIIENEIRGFQAGIHFAFSKGTSVDGNHVSDCSAVGVGSMDQLYDCAINSNEIEDCTAGIQIITEGNNNTIKQNFLYQIQDSGIELYGNPESHQFVNSTIICENTLFSDSYFIDTKDGYGNNITNNDVFGRYGDVACLESSCTNYYTTNYWNDYDGTDIDGDGLGDSPYLVAMPNASDYHPRVRPYGLIPFALQGERYFGTMTGNASVSCIRLNETTKIIGFNVSGQGYCNFTVPRKLLDGSFKIFINNTQMPWLSSWNLTNTSIYFEYETSVVVSVKIEAQMRLIGDMNSDGVVNILDIFLVAKNFGKSIENP